MEVGTETTDLGFTSDGTRRIFRTKIFSADGIWDDFETIQICIHCGVRGDDEFWADDREWEEFHARGACKA